MFKREDDKEIVEERTSSSVIRRYVKGRLLGKGGFARCYQFYSEQTNKRYAGKVIQKCSLQQNRAREKLQSQIRIHQVLKHRNIVHFQHSFQDTDYVYIMLQICPNQTLNELLRRRKRLSQIQVRYYIHQIALALLYLRNMHIIHRDLKLSNLFLSELLEVKLGDFGLAALIGATGRKQKTVCGTPNYIAPEVLESKGHSYEVDVWGLGVVMYALLYGKPPFQTSDVKTTYNKIKHCNYALPEVVRISNSGKKLIGRMLQVEPSKRATLEQILEDEFVCREEIPLSLPRSTLACPPNDAFFQQIKKHTTEKKNNSRDLNKEVSKQKLFKKIDSKLQLCKEEEQKQLNKQCSVQWNRQCGVQCSDKQCNMQCSKQEKLVKITQFQENYKFGLCYGLNNNTIGMRFNDMTCLLANNQCSKFKYVELEQLKQAHKEIFSGANFPQKLRKKLKILNHYKKQLKSEQAYVVRYFDCHQGYLFWFNNGNIQAIFNDESQIVLSKVHGWYIDKAGERCQFLSKESQKQIEDIKNRIKFIMDVVKKLRRRDCSQKLMQRNQSRQLQRNQSKQCLSRSRLARTLEVINR